MKERPILFSAEMIQAILENRKTMTRRAMKLNDKTILSPEQRKLGWTYSIEHVRVGDIGKVISAIGSGTAREEVDQQISVPARHPDDSRIPWEECGYERIYCPYGSVGDRLWVITIKPITFGGGRFGVGDDGGLYRIDGNEPRPMRTRPNHNGYEEVRVRFSGTQRALRLNRLVCEAFYGAPAENDVCRHLDGNRRNNLPENLDWGTDKQNQADAASAGSFSGENGSQTRLSAAAVDDIRTSPDLQSVLAARHGVTQPTISKIRSRKRWATPPAAPPPNCSRWASRITLEITGVKVERVQDIGKDGRKACDVLAEGVTRESIEHNQKWFHQDDAPAITFASLWNSISGKGSWESNPWVFAISFKRIGGGA